MKDPIGDRMKKYESRETSRVAFTPLVVRIDGRSFSKFTKGFKKPFDADMHNAMCETTKRLVKDSHCLIGYTQSDEITLIFDAPKGDSEVLFNGKFFKLTSVLASIATSEFTFQAMNNWPMRVATRPPTFDCRVFEVPNRTEATNALLWREFDATKNSISMLAQSQFSHSELQGKSGSEMQDMLMLQKGINWNDCEDWQKRGSYFRRETVQRELTGAELQEIPAQHRPTGPVTRTVINRIDMPIFVKVTNREQVVFDGAEPMQVIDDTLFESVMEQGC